MAKQKQDIAGKTIPELLADVSSLENEYQQMKFDHAVRGLGNPMELRQIRRDIARIHTELRAREMADFTPEQLEMRSKLRARRRRQS